MEVPSLWSLPSDGTLNLQEMWALKLDLRRLCTEDLPACRAHRRIVVGVDSRVVCGVASKGRSSSYKLNGVMRTMLPVLLCGQISCAYPWVETHCNPADHPSRFAPLPPLLPLAQDVADTLGKYFVAAHVDSPLPEKLICDPKVLTVAPAIETDPLDTFPSDHTMQCATTDTTPEDPP